MSEENRKYGPIADELAVASRRESVSCMDLAALIQKALDEAEHRGQAKLREEIKQEEEMCDRLALANKKFYDENAKLRGVVERLREVVEEASLPPYHDSDAVSLLQTLAVRAKRVLAESAEVLGEE